MPGYRLLLLWRIKVRFHFPPTAALSLITPSNATTTANREIFSFHTADSLNIYIIISFWGYKALLIISTDVDDIFIDSTIEVALE